MIIYKNIGLDSIRKKNKEKRTENNCSFTLCTGWHVSKGEI